MSDAGVGGVVGDAGVGGVVGDAGVGGVEGVVLAGGASSRMGTDKALVEIEGRAMAALVAAALRDGGCDPVWCQGGDTAALARIGLETRPDVGGDADGRPGPIRAIASALDTATVPVVVVAACDLPALTGDVVRSLVDVARRDGTAAVATADGRRHLVIAWPVALRPSLHDAIERGARSVGALLDMVGAVEVTVDSAVVRNVNAPADLPGGAVSQRYPRATMTVPEISVDDLAPLLDAGARLVDVREPDEYEQGHVPGATLVPLGTVPDSVDAFRGDGATYVICRSGARSMRACEFLAEQGIDVVNVAGGTLAWIDSGRDVAAGDA